jgi:DNA-binding NarL/FixJ family response regulator
MAESSGVEKVIGVPVLALYGESLLIEGLEASLKDREGVEIVHLDTSRPTAVQVLDKLSPDVIVFDVNPGQLSCVFTFLRTHTDVVLIGLDIDRDLALFLSGEWRRLPTVADLMQVIEAQIQVKNARRL